jgi:hypothetical protein
MGQGRDRGGRVRRQGVEPGKATGLSIGHIGGNIGGVEIGFRDCPAALPGGGVSRL